MKIKIHQKDKQIKFSLVCYLIILPRFLNKSISQQIHFEIRRHLLNPGKHGESYHRQFKRVQVLQDRPLQGVQRLQHGQMHRRRHLQGHRGESGRK